MTNKKDGPPQDAEAPAHKIITASVVHDAVRLEGEGELARPSAALAWSGLAAGLAMGFSMVGEGVLQARLDPEDWRPLITKLGYAVGFVIVTLGRQQLFTENTLTAVIPALEQRKWSTWGHVLRLWCVVLLTNLIGAFLFAAFASTDAFAPKFHEAFLEIGQAAIASEPSTIFLTGIPAGMLIALIVWLGPAVPSSRLFIALLLAYVVGLGEFAHVIAGSVETLFLVVTGHATFWEYITIFLLPSLFGNIIGGVLLVAGLNHAQATAKK